MNRKAILFAALAVLIAGATAWELNHDDGSEAYAANIADVAVVEVRRAETMTAEIKTEPAAITQHNEAVQAKTGDTVLVAKKKEPAAPQTAIMAATRTEKDTGSQKWLRVDIQKSVLEKTTEPEFRAFCEKVVKGSGYSWVTIACGDGTGIQFVGSFAGAAEYGKIDGNGRIDEPLGYISLKDGVYAYVDADDVE